MTTTVFDSVCKGYFAVIPNNTKYGVGTEIVFESAEADDGSGICHSVFLKIKLKKVI